MGSLSLGGPWGHEATIFVSLDDYLVRLRVAGAAGTAATLWAWSEDCGGLRRFLEEVSRRITLAPARSPAAGWQSLARLAERQEDQAIPIARVPDPSGL